MTPIRLPLGWLLAAASNAPAWTGRLLLALVFLQPPAAACGQELVSSDATRLAPASRSTCVFAARDTSVSIKLQRVAETRLTMSWDMATVNGRVLYHSSNVYNNDRPGDDLVLDLEIPLPPLKPGASLPLKMRVSTVLDGQEHRIVLPLTAYAEDAFAGCETMLKELRIHLFDPEGATAQLLDQQNIPYTRLIDLAAIDRVDSEVLIVGEGVSLRDNRNLGETLTNSAQRGAQVLCLAPREGTIPLHLDIAADRLPRLALDPPSIVQRYGRRLDVEDWGGQKSVITRFAPVAADGFMAIAVSEDELGWPWVRIEYDNKRSEHNNMSRRTAATGHLILCGFGLVSRWDESPVPRHFLAQLFNEFAEQSTLKE